MGREVRRVPKDWQHPKYTPEECLNRPNLIGCYKSLLDGSYADRAAEWDSENEAWKRGEVRDYSRPGVAFKKRDANENGSYEDWAGARPEPGDYMPDWPESARTHLQMYETTSEGTPISPVMETPEELARWLADNGASTFADQTADYETWLRMIRRGWAVSAVVSNGVLRSGVEGL